MGNLIQRAAALMAAVIVVLAGIACGAVWAQVPDIVIDNGGAGYSEFGTWFDGTASDAYGGSYRYAATNINDGFRGALFKPTIVTAGIYQVFSWVSSARSTGPSLCTIHSADGDHPTFYQQSGDGSGWQLQGTFRFDAGTDGYYKIASQSGSGWPNYGGIIVADAVKFVYGAPALPPADPQGLKTSIDYTTLAGGTTTWQADASSTGFEVKLRTTSGGNEIYGPTNQVDAFKVWTDLTPGASYYITVIGSNQYGDSNLVTEGFNLVPQPLTNLSTSIDYATLSGGTTTWLAGAGSTGFEVKLGTTRGGSEVYGPAVQAGTAKAWTDLTPGRTYWVVVRGVNAGVSTSPIYENFTLIPPMPSGFTVQRSSSDPAAATAKWSGPSPSYEVALGTTKGGEDALPPTSVTVRSHTFGGLTAGVSYYAKVRSTTAGLVSSWVTAQPFVVGTVATPGLSLSSGTYASPKYVTVTCTTSGATIHYTTNDAEPATGDPAIVSGSRLRLDASQTIKAKAWKDLFLPSQTTTATYAMTIESPSIHPEGGTYSAPQVAAISCQSPGATIHYTTDGSDPDESSNILAPGARIQVEHDMTLKARAFNAACEGPSAVTTATYILVDLPGSPTFLPDGGTYASPQAVTITCPDSNATIRYTMDGTTPTIYSSRIAPGDTVQVGYDATLEATAFKGTGSSIVTSADYVITSTAGLGYWSIALEATAVSTLPGCTISGIGKCYVGVLPGAREGKDGNDFVEPPPPPDPYVRPYELRSDWTSKLCSDIRAPVTNGTKVFSNWYIFTTAPASAGAFSMSDKSKAVLFSGGELAGTTTVTLSWAPGTGDYSLPVGNFKLYARFARDITDPAGNLLGPSGAAAGSWSDPVVFDLSSAGSFSFIVMHSAEPQVEMRVVARIGDGPKLWNVSNVTCDGVTCSPITCAPVTDEDGSVYFGSEALRQIWKCVPGTDKNGNPSFVLSNLEQPASFEGNVKGRMGYYAGSLWGVTDSGGVVKRNRSGDTTGNAGAFQNANMSSTPCVRTDSLGNIQNIFVGCGTTLQELDSSCETVATSPDLGGAVGSPSVPVPERVWVNAGSSLYCLNSDMTVRAALITDADGPVGNPTTNPISGVTAAVCGSQLRWFDASSLQTLSSYAAGDIIQSQPFVVNRGPMAGAWFAANDHKLYRADPATGSGEVVATLPGSGPITGDVVVAPDGSVVAVAGGADQTVYFYKTATGTVSTISVNSAIYGCSYIKDNRFVFTSADGCLYVVEP